MTSTNKLLVLMLPLALAMAGCNGGGSSVSTDSGAVTNPGNTGDSSPLPGGSSPGDSYPDEPGQSEPAPGDDDGKNDGGDNQAPRIVSTTPENQSDSVSTSGTVTVKFDEAIDPASITALSVTLLGPTGVVEADLTANNDELVLEPKRNLSAGGSYTVTVSPAVKDLAGNLLGDAYSWQFVTASGVCADFYSSSFSLVEGKDATPPASNLSKPAKGVPYADPAYGTCVVRVTDHEKEGLDTQARNLYSRIQPFNADDSRLLIHSLDGRFHLYDVNTMKFIRTLSLGGGSVEPQWHPTNPDIIYVLPNHGGMTISKVNVVTDARTVVADFRHVESINGHPGATSLLDVWPTAARVWTHWEGSPSADARYWAFMVETSSGAPLGMISYDLEQNVITGTFDYGRDGGGIGAPDHISMSPSGKYVVPSWNGSGENCPSRAELGTRSNPCGLMSYTRDFSAAVGLTVRGPHSDIGIDANGRDVIVAGDYASGWVEMWDLGTGENTRLWQIYENGNSTAMHISAKNFDKPGWVLVSTYMEKAPGWYANKLFAVEMKANPRILNIAHSYNIVETYYSETHASVNRDFTRVVFNSNWNTANMDNIDTYMVVLPEDAVPYK